MTNKLRHKRDLYLSLIPLFGIFIFIILYITAAFLYPGGSKVNINEKGFSLLHNYWCDLMNEKAKNGEINPSKPIAITAMFILCSSLTFFWYYLPFIFNFSLKYEKIIQYNGIVSMIITVFLFTDYHDQVINISGLLVTMSLITASIGFYQEKLI